MIKKHWDKPMSYTKILILRLLYLIIFVFLFYFLRILNEKITLGLNLFNFELFEKIIMTRDIYISRKKIAF